MSRNCKSHREQNTHLVMHLLKGIALHITRVYLEYFLASVLQKFPTIWTEINLSILSLQALKPMEKIVGLEMITGKVDLGN